MGAVCWLHWEAWLLKRSNGSSSQLGAICRLTALGEIVAEAPGGLSSLL